VRKKIHFTEKAALVAALSYEAPLLPAAYLAYKGYNFYRKRRYLKHSAPVLAASAMAPYNFQSNTPPRTPRKRKAPMMDSRKSASRRLSYPNRSSVGVGTSNVATQTAPMRVRRSRYVRVGSIRTRKNRRMRIRRKYRKPGLYTVPKRFLKDCYNSGCNIKHERGGFSSDPFCVILGHTLPFAQLRRAFFMAILKKLFDKAGLSMESPETGMNLISAGDQVFLYYRTNARPENTPLLQISITLDAADSLSTVTNKVITLWNATPGMKENEQLYWESALFFGAGPNDTTSCRISLIGAQAAYYMRSTMKVQNRTRDSVENTQADDLDAQYVVGKSYDGYGNYTQNRARSAQPNQLSICGDITGVISTSSIANTSDQLKEPVSAKQFTNVSSSASVKFNPGELKTSHIYYQCSLPLDEFYKELVRNYDLAAGSVAVPVKIKKSKFRFFMLEKQIETLYNVSPATNVTVSWEVNSTIGCCIYPHKNTFMTAENFVGRAISSV